MRRHEDPLDAMIELIPSPKRLARFDKRGAKSKNRVVLTDELHFERRQLSKSLEIPKNNLLDGTKKTQKKYSLINSYKSSEVESTSSNTALWLQLMPFATGWREAQKFKKEEIVQKLPNVTQKKKEGNTKEKLPNLKPNEKDFFRNLEKSYSAPTIPRAASALGNRKRIELEKHIQFSRSFPRSHSRTVAHHVI